MAIMIPPGKIEGYENPHQDHALRHGLFIYLL